MRNLFGQVIEKRSKRGSGGTRTKRMVERGCEHCPLDNIPGLNKVKGLVQIEGRRAMLWSQSPSKLDNQKRKVLVGNAGQFLWGELERVDMPRDKWDVQSVLRCQPIDKYGIEHPPTKQELYACSIHNEEALERNGGKANVHLVLGKIAGAALFGRNYKKDRPVFWYQPWNAYVVLADHPSFLLRIGGVKGGWPYFAFRDRMKAAAICYKYPGRYGYIKAQDYKAVKTKAEWLALEKILRAEAKAGRRIAVDIEDGYVEGKKVMLMIGFGWGQYARGKGMGEWAGGARSVILSHPEGKQSDAQVEELLELMRPLLEDPKIKKVMQHGNYDQDSLAELAGIKIRGYDFDTQYGLYLKHPHIRTYSIDSMIKFFLQEFQDYKTMPEEYRKPDKSINYAEIPLEKLVPYNCADCDATKRAEQKTMDAVNLALMQVYIRVASVLDAMQKRGPLLDWQAHKKLSAVVDEKLTRLTRELRQAAHDPEFNPATPKEVGVLLYDKLKLPVPTLERIGGKKVKQRGTGKDVLNTLIATTGHPVIEKILFWRKLSKVKGTYLKGFAKSAEMNGGELRTIWHLTGAVTGRLRSGKGDKSQEQGIINFQNLHGNPLLKNLLVSDPNWRVAYTGKWNSE